MKNLVLIGVSHRRGGVEVLEAWHRHFQEVSLGDFVKNDFKEAAVLTTCNRFEWLVVMPESMTISTAKAKLIPPGYSRCYTYIGEGAIEHLSRVAASLDSLNPGEDQIMMQVREAYAKAKKEKTAGKNVHLAFETAFRIAKRIRSEIPLAPLHASLFSLARPEMEAFLPERATIGIIGAGEIGSLAYKILQERKDTKLYVINRNVERAKKLIEKFSVQSEVISLEQFLASPPVLDGVVTATPVEGLLSRKVLERMKGLRVAVDMGIPRNIDYESAVSLGVDVLDVHTLQEAGKRRREKIEEHLIQAEELLITELDQAMDEWIVKQLGPSIQKLRQRYIDTMGEMLPEQDTKRLANRFAHIPMKGLRALVREYGLQAARVFFSAADW